MKRTSYCQLPDVHSLVALVHCIPYSRFSLVLPLRRLCLIPFQCSPTKQLVETREFVALNSMSGLGVRLKKCPKNLCSHAQPAFAPKQPSASSHGFHVRCSHAQPVHPNNLPLLPHGFHVRCSHAQPIHPNNLLLLPHGFHVRCSHVQPVHFQRRDSSMSNVRVALGSGVGINKDIRHIVTDIPTYIIVANGKIKTSLGERRWTGTISTTLKSTRILSTGFELELSLQPERTAKPLCIPSTVHFMPKPGCCSVLNLNRYKFRC